MIVFNIVYISFYVIWTDMSENKLFVIVIVIVIVSFVFHSTETFFFWRGGGGGGGREHTDECMDNVLKLLIQESGLSASIGTYLIRFGGWPVWSIVLLLSTVTALLTELTSNTATATIFLPIIAELVSSSSNDDDDDDDDSNNLLSL